jgi:hypothetical protein
MVTNITILRFWFLFSKADDMTDNDMIDFDDDRILPMAREWVAKRVTHVSYEDAESFFYFIDKYTTIVIGGQRAMDKFYKDNRNKTLFDKITASDIAYSVLVYESYVEVWKEEIQRSRACKTAKERKEFPMTEVLKYHVKRGTRIPLFQDGWTKEGREYYQQLCNKFRILLTSTGLMTVLLMHWKTFVKKYHKKSYYRLQQDLDGDVDEIENDCGDDDCIVSLPGELDEGISDDESESGYNKRQRLFPV